MQVHDREVAKAIEYAGKIQGFVHQVGLAADSHTDDVECSECGFVMWKWQHSCPRCSAKTKGETNVSSNNER